MWDTVLTTAADHLSHDLPCQHCGHAPHTYLACDAGCGCEPATARAPQLAAAGARS